MTPSSPTCVAVLGMHRSGTSALTRLIHELGVALPACADLGVGRSLNPANARGFWEPRLLVHANEQLLAGLGASWSTPPDTLGPDSDYFGRGGRYQRALVKYHEAAPAWVWKDPRLCLTLGHWEPMLGPLVTVVALRHPAEVASSLAARNGFDVALGFALWEHYVINSLEAARGKRTVVVMHDALIADPVATARHLGQALRSFGVAALVDEAGIGDSIDPSLSSSGRAPGGPAPDSVLAMWRALAGLEPVSDSFDPPHMGLSVESRALLDERRSSAGGNPRRRRKVLAAWAVEIAKRAGWRAR